MNERIKQFLIIISNSLRTHCHASNRCPVGKFVSHRTCPNRVTFPDNLEEGFPKMNISPLSGGYRSRHRDPQCEMIKWEITCLTGSGRPVKSPCRRRNTGNHGWLGPKLRDAEARWSTLMPFRQAPNSVGLRNITYYLEIELIL